MNANTIIKQTAHPVFARHIAMQQNEHDAKHNHPWHQLIVARRGTLRTRADHREYFVPYNRALLIPATTEHESWAVTPADFLGIYLNPKAFKITHGHCKMFELTNLYREMLYHWAEHTNPLEQPSKEQAHMAQVLIDLSHQQKEVQFDLALPRSPQVAAVVQALLTNPTHPHSAADWANNVGTSVSTLERIFRRETGLSFAAWRQSLRLYHSLTLLEMNHSVKHVAIEAGYRSPSAFIHRFKNEFGQTPLQYANIAQASAANKNPSR